MSTDRPPTRRPGIPADPHAADAPAVARGLDVDPGRGLAGAEAARRLAAVGPNALAEPTRRSDLALLAGQLRSPLVLVLLAAAAVTLALGRVLDASVILGVVVVNALIGLAQEGKAERALAALTAMTEVGAVALRDGSRVRLPARELVPGDVVLLAAGDRIPADVRILEASELRASEAALTGESAPVAKDPAPVPRGTPLAERTGMAWAGTLAAAGQGSGVVVATGGDTEIGRIQRLAASATPLETPLTRQIAAFSRTLALVILALAALTFVVGALRAEPLADSFVAAVALAVGAIPEGLPAAVTISLALGVSRMARRRAIVRRLPAVETLGSTTVIGTDKTGTLTRNEMAVRAVVAGGERTDVPDGPWTPPSAAAAETLRAGALACEARLDPATASGAVVGDPTELALLHAAADAGLDPAALAERSPRTDVLPFSSERGMMATVHADAGRPGGVAYVKGAPDRVIALCDTEVGADGAEHPIDAERARAAAHVLGDEGLRVLAVARGDRRAGAPPLAEAPPAGLVLLGMEAMLDPPRAAAPGAVAECRAAGVAIKMITGDQPGTARAVARAVGLRGPDGAPRVATGGDIDRAGRAGLGELAAGSDVFARVTPEHKLDLVRALQADGEVVAMTGDGVNDAPALRQADIGVAMGITGTDAAKESADLVLLDDDVATIAAAVEEGRRVFDNITKFIAWTLPTNLGEGMVIMVAVLLGLTLPITPLQILWINMTTAVALGLMLAFEPAEPGIMHRPPRPPGRPILTAALVRRIVLVSGLLLAVTFGLLEWSLASGADLAEARTVAVNAFVAGEIAYLFACRSLDGHVGAPRLGANPLIWVGVLTTIALQLVFTYLPAMQAAFGTVAIGAREWTAAVLAGLAVGLVVEVEKRLGARLRRRAEGA